jgi:MFS family permease
MTTTAANGLDASPSIHHVDATTGHQQEVTPEKPARIPTRQREDGIEVLEWDGPNDPDNPVNWTKRKKWTVTGAALFATLIVCWNGTSIAVAATEINAEFGISDASFPNSYWPIASWSFGGAIFVILFIPVMEDVGVRFAFMIAYAFFLLMIVPQALAQNFATLIVTRFFSGGCVSLLANTISSMIPDVWETDEERSVPIGIYIVFYLMGNTLGLPVFGGVTQYLNSWRW